MRPGPGSPRHRDPSWLNPSRPLANGVASLRKDAENPEFLTADLRRSKEFRDARTGIQKIREEVNHFLDSYAAHRAFDDVIAPVESRLDAIADHPSGVAAQTSVEAYQLLDESRLGHARGDLGFSANIEQVVALIEQGEQAVEAEELRIKKEADRRQLVRRTLMIVFVFLAIALFLLLWILNIRLALHFGVPMSYLSSEARRLSTSWRNLTS